MVPLLVPWSDPACEGQTRIGPERCCIGFRKRRNPGTTRADFSIGWRFVDNFLTWFTEPSFASMKSLIVTNDFGNWFLKKMETMDHGPWSMDACPTKDTCLRLDFSLIKVLVEKNYNPSTSKDMLLVRKSCHQDSHLAQNDGSSSMSQSRPPSPDARTIVICRARHAFPLRHPGTYNVQPCS